MTAADDDDKERPSWTIHLCAMTEDQQPFERALRSWLLDNGHRLTEVSGLPLLARLEVVRAADLCIVLLGPTLGTCDPLSVFSYAELEAAAPADAHPGKLLVFAQAGVDEPTAPEQREFIDRLRNFAGGTFQATCQTPDELLRQVHSALAVWQPPRPREPPLAAEPPPGALMISSTGDLVAERSTVHDMLDREGFPVIDYLRAASETVAPIERITSWASGCAALVLVLGSRYGYISPVDGLGITELEFVTALRAGRPILVFLRADAEASPDADERQFAERVRALVPPQQVFPFSDLDMLRRQLSGALGLLRAGQARPGVNSAPAASARRWYRRQVQRWLGRTPHLTRPEGMPLEAAYVSVHRAKDEVVNQRNRGTAIPSVFWDTRQVLQRDALTVDDALRQYPRLILRGAPGAGKSVTLHWYAITAPDDVTPVLIRLQAYARARAAGQVASLLDVVAREEQRLALAPGADRSLWRVALQEGRGLLLLDGFDQVPIAEQGRVAAEIGELARELPETSRIVVATRESAEIGALAGVFTACDVLAPNRDQARRLLLRLLSVAHGDTGADAEREQVERRASVALVYADRPETKQWVSTPLMLALLAVLADSLDMANLSLPKSQAEILRRVLRLLIGRWKTLNQQRSYWHLIEKERLLLGLAREGTLKGQAERMTWARAEALWAEAPASLRATPLGELVRELSEQDGLLVRQGEGELSFLHSMFSAYLSAKLVTALPLAARQEQVAHRRLSGRWEETALLLVGELDRVGRHDDADDVVETLRLADRQPISVNGVPDPLHGALCRAARCLGARAGDAITNAVGRAVAADLMHVWRGWRGQPIPHVVRMRTMMALAELGPALTPMLDDLIEMLDDPHNRAFLSSVLRALGALANGGNERAGEAIKRYNERVNSGQPLQYSAMSVDALRQRMRDSSPGQRMIAASQLAQLGVAAIEALPELRDALWDADYHVRSAAVRALGAMGPAAGAAAADLFRLLEASEREVSEAGRLSTVILPALGEMGPAARSISDALLARVFGPQATPDEMGIGNALRRIGLTERGRGMFLQAVNESGDSERRGRAYRLLPALTPHLALDWRDVLARGLERTQAGPPYYPAGQVLRELPAEDARAAVMELRGALRSPDWSVRSRATGVLTAMGPAAAPALPELEQILQSENDTIASVALEVVASISSASAPLVDMLHARLRALRDSTSSYQVGGVVRALECIGPAVAPAVPELCALMRNPDHGVRLAAAGALDAIGSAAAPAAGALREALHDADAGMRHHAARALATFGTAAAPAVGDLFAMLSDPNRSVSQIADAYLPSLLSSIEDATYVPPPAPTHVGG